MKKAVLTISFLCLFASLKSFAQTGQICFIRSTGTTGSAVNMSVYIDDSLACKLKNKSYSLHDVPAGEHTVSAISGGLASKRKMPFKVTVADGKISYINVINMDNTTTEEVTENTGSQKIKMLIQNTNCSRKK